MFTIQVLTLVALWCGNGFSYSQPKTVQDCRDNLINCLAGKNANDTSETLKISDCFQKQKYGK